MMPIAGPRGMVTGCALKRASPRRVVTGNLFEITGGKRQPPSRISNIQITRSFECVRSSRRAFSRWASLLAARERPHGCFDAPSLVQFLGEADGNHLRDAGVATENGRQHLRPDRRSLLRHVVIEH